MHGPRYDKYLRAFGFAQQQVDALVQNAPDYFPIYTVGGRWRHGGELWTDWTGGFLAGMMWKFYGRSGQMVWRDRAEHYSSLLEHRKHDRLVHDLGFIFLNTYRPWYLFTHEPRLREVLIEAGRTLAERFMERGQYLRSFVAEDSLFIDIMMNVPLVCWAAKATEDKELERRALAHCREATHQGLAPDSSWARGLAWSMYGFSQVYAITGLTEFLDVAECNAGYWLANLPKDHVPYWDFKADLSQPLPWGPQKDSSAAAIAASALLDLELQTKEVGRAVIYRTTAEAMLDALVEPEYLASETPGWEGILKHGVYHTQKNLGVDESVMWGEFFFVEALDKALGRQWR
jgi:unsaturated chondroitin disaccharide hydrolase